MAKQIMNITKIVLMGGAMIYLCTGYLAESIVGAILFTGLKYEI